MTDQQFQHQVATTLKSIDRTLKEALIALKPRQEQAVADSVTPAEPEDTPEPATMPVQAKVEYKSTQAQICEQAGGRDFKQAHICMRGSKLKLVPFAEFLCSMCHGSSSIDIFIENERFTQLEELLKYLQEE